jgi:alkylation response protein AidB-like acyl-CoA dehydrogenase
MTTTTSVAQSTNAGVDLEVLTMIMTSLHEFVAAALPESRRLELDHENVCPEDVVRRMCSADELGIQLLFVPEAYGGMGGGSFDVYRVCEQMARIDIGLATSVLATSLGSDPVSVGGTEEQKKAWLTPIAEKGFLFAYGATEPEAGSDLGALHTTATPVIRDGALVGYKLNGAKQWISNGGIADSYSILALAPGGPSWFVISTGADGFKSGNHEDKHGIRLSNTAPLFLHDVFAPVESLLGGVEGQGLVQAQEVFGYTRLMVAAFGLGGGWEALDRAISYSAERVQAGATLSNKQGYTHKLIVPHAVRLEAGRASIEETSSRIDAGEGVNGALNTEGSIAKFFATEAGNAAAEAAIQAHGGYGYTREYQVEKIKRDVRITTIYEGTSEIMEMTISRNRWQQHLMTKGEFYRERARELTALHSRLPDVGAGAASLATSALAGVLEACRVARLTRHQHILLRLGELMAWAECAGSLARRAAAAADGTLPEKADTRFTPSALAAVSRVFAREAAQKVAEDGHRWVRGAAAPEADLTNLEAQLHLDEIRVAQAGLVADMDLVADALYGRSA